MTASNPTLTRLGRILTMVPWLLENPGVAVDEVAERFSTTPEQLLDDLDVLGYCGLPGYGGGDLVEVAIYGGRITVRMAPFFARPLQLSIREAVTLLLAGRALAGVEGLAESAALERATEKVAGLLGAVAGDVARIAVEIDAEGAEHLSALRRAVDQARVVRLAYRSKDGRTREREVEPWRLTAAQGAWYLQGFCRDAGGPRDFRLDRIREIAHTDESAPPPPDEVHPPVYRPGPGDARVVLDLAPEADWVIDWAVVDDVVDAGDRRRVTMRTAHLEWAARLVLRLGGAATVVEPDELRAAVRDLVEQALARYEEAERSQMTSHPDEGNHPNGA